MHHYGQAMLLHEVQWIPTQTAQACLEIAADTTNNQLAGDLNRGRSSAAEAFRWAVAMIAL